MLLILTAVLIEATPIAKALQLTRCSPTHWSGITAHLHVAGIRALHLSPSYIPKPCRGIILAGLAGALDPSLAVGDVLLDVTSDALPPSPPCRVGAIYSAEKIAATPQAKTILWKQHRAMAVEMEAHLVRRFAAENKMPFMHLRAISDTAGEELNPAVLGMVDSIGRPKPLAITAALLKQPGLIPALNHLRKASAIATKNLAVKVSSIVAAGWPGP